MDQTNSPAPPLTVSVAEAGRLLGISRAATYQTVKEGRLACLRFGRTIRVPRVAVERLVAEAAAASTCRGAGGLGDPPHTARRQRANDRQGTAPR